MSITELWQMWVDIDPATRAHIIHVSIDFLVVAVLLILKGDWNGLIGLIKKRCIDLIGESLEPGEKREKVVDFVYDTLSNKLKTYKLPTMVSVLINVFLTRENIAWLVRWVYKNKVAPFEEQIVTERQLREAKEKGAKAASENPDAVKEIDGLLGDFDKDQ